MLSFIFVIVCDLFEWEQICAGFLSFVYICIGVGDESIKSGRGRGIQFNGLIPPFVCACPKSGSEFSTSYFLICFVFNELR